MPEKKKPLKAPGKTAQQARSAGWNDPLQPQQPLVSGRWLLSAIGAVILLAAVCAYAALCLLFYQGSWQLIFHPSRVITKTPASFGIAFDYVRFDYTETGKPQLAGWWVPAGINARYTGNTVLLLRDGKGSLSDCVDQVRILHSLGINVFVFDYRGFGQSADVHPSEQSMNQDTDAAWRYLTDTRHVSGHSIIFYGTGLGASVAATAVTRHVEAPAVVLENISPTALTLLAADSRTKLLPVRLLTSDRFDPAKVLDSMRMPKLFIEQGTSPQTENLFHRAGFPKRLVQLAPGDEPSYSEALRAFLDEAIPHP